MVRRNIHIFAVSSVSALLCIAAIFNCSSGKAGDDALGADSLSADSVRAGQKKSKKRIPFAHITTERKFEQIFKSSGDTLLVFDLYADWCMPCKMLEPTLKKVAKEYPESAHYYKINIDMLPSVARAFRATSIPLIAFVKNKKIVESIPGVQPKSVYVEAIKKHGLKPAPEKEPADSAAPAVQNLQQT